MVQIKDFSVGQDAYILRWNGKNWDRISTTVTRIGRKYVTVSGDRRFTVAEFTDFGFDAKTEYLFEVENYGRKDYLFRTKEDADAFLSNWKKKRYIINVVNKLSMHSFDDDYSVIDKVYNACKELEEVLSQ